MIGLRGFLFNATILVDSLLFIFTAFVWGALDEKTKNYKGMREAFTLLFLFEILNVATIFVWC